MASTTKTATTATEEDPNLYELKFVQSCSDGRECPEDRYPKGYVRVPDDDYKRLEWLMKLANLYRDQCRELNKNDVFFFRDFPAGYHLRSKKREGEKGRGKSDYYLFGWPNPDKEGRPKSYRSPNEFLPHLIWIAEGSRDMRRCACHLCLQRCHDAVSRKRQPAQPVAREHGHPSSGFPPATSTPSQMSLVSQAPPVLQTSSIAQAAPATAQPPLRRTELFRAGEVIWYQHGNAWRLGIILFAQEGQTGIQWYIKPLAHPYYLKAEDVYKTEKELRPFLAFSVPVIDPALLGIIQDGGIANMDSEQQQSLRLSLEASKAGAATVDHSYSTFNKQDDGADNVSLSPPSITKSRTASYVDSLYAPYNYIDGDAIKYYRGVFLGCERIELGDPVRVRHPCEEGELGPVLVVKNIIVDAQDKIRFFGDIYCLKRPSSPDEMPRHEVGLPPAMEEDMAVWNRFKSHPGGYFVWVLKAQADVWEDNIRGRFYSTYRLRQLIDPTQLQEDLNNGVVEGAQAYLNNRRSSQGQYVGRRKNRMETVKDSLPPTPPMPVPIGTNVFGTDVFEDV